MAKKKSEFETKLNRLNEIVETISNQSLSLDESLKLYEEGEKLIQELEKELSEAESKIEKIVPIKEK